MFAVTSYVKKRTPEFYLSALQDTFRNMFLVVRTSVEPAGVAAVGASRNG